MSQKKDKTISNNPQLNQLFDESDGDMDLMNIIGSFSYKAWTSTCPTNTTYIFSLTGNPF